jgi:hypothetical protein
VNQLTVTQPRHANLSVQLDGVKTAMDIIGKVRRTMLLGGAPMKDINYFVGQAGMSNKDIAQVIELARQYVMVEGQPTLAEDREQAAEDAAHEYWDEPAREL